MRKTLFSKIFFSQLLSALTIIFIVIPTLFWLIGDYFISEQKKYVLQDADRVGKLTEIMLNYNLDEDAWEAFEKGIEFAGSRSSIIVLDENGEILTAPGEHKGIKVSKIDKKYVELVRDGKPVVKIKPENSTFSMPTLIAVVPIEKIDPVSGKTELLGASMALRPMQQVEALQNRIITIVVMAQVVACILAFVVSLFLNRQILKPIKKIRVAAKNIASGNFKERIPITSNDEIGQLSETFNSMTQSLDELEKMRSSFISDVSHELRTPMTIISGFVEGILDGTIPEEEKSKYLEIVLSETKRLSRLVSDLLESSRLEQGKVVIEKKNVDINRLAAECIIAYEKNLTQKELNIDMSLDEEECYAFADKDAIKRVMLNLIDNAVKFTPEKGSIKIVTERRNSKVYVTVENSGEGLSKDELRHIWERFYKSDKSRSKDKKGVGLGLHIVKTIVSQHGGEITAQSEEGKYTRFIFSLEEGKKTSDAVKNKTKE